MKYHNGNDCPVCTTDTFVVMTVIVTLILYIEGGENLSM